jgi:hypothetical protein
LDAIDEKETPITPNQMTTFIQSLLGLRKNYRALYPEDADWSMKKKALVARGADDYAMLDAMSEVVEPLRNLREQTRDLLERVQLTNVVPVEVGKKQRAPWTSNVTLFKYGLYSNEAINFKIHHVFKSGGAAGVGQALVSNVNVELARLYIEWDKPSTWGTLPFLESPLKVSFEGDDLDDSRAVCCSREEKRQRTAENAAGGSGSGGSGSGSGAGGSGSGSSSASGAGGGARNAAAAAAEARMAAAGGGSAAAAAGNGGRDKGKKRARDQ